MRGRLERGLDRSALQKQSVTRRKKLQMPFLDGTEVEQLTEDREIIGESLIFLKQYRDKTMNTLQEKGDIRDEAEGRQKLTELRGKMTEDVCRERRRSACEETRSCV